MCKASLFATVLASLTATALVDPTPAFAQEGPTLHGTVTDAATGMPVPGATVLDSETGEAAFTGEDGSFELRGTGTPVTLVVLGPLYKRAEVASDGITAAAIRLEPDELGGEQIVIQGERDHATAGETTLKREEILRVPGARGDALAAIKNLPGVANTQGFGPNAGLVIRGSSPADSRIFVDGFEIPILYHLGGIQSVLPSEMIDDLVYTPGAFGVELGRASGGTVQVASRKGARQLAGFAEVSFINAAMMLQGPLGDRGSFAISARRSYIDAVIPLVVSSDSLAFTALPRYYDYQARADYALTDHWKLTGFLFGSDDKFGVSTDGQDPNQPAQLDNTSRFTRAIVSATYDAPGVSNKLSASGMTQRTGLTLAADRFLSVKPDTLSARDEARLRIATGVTAVGGGEVEGREVAVRIKLPRPPKEGDPRQPGLMDSLLDTTTDRTQSQVAGWAALELQPIARLKATAGVRVDDFRFNHVTVVQPRLQTRLTVTDGTAVLAAGGLYTRPPDNQDENLDPKLKPERAWQTSAGVEQRLAKGVTLTATGYYTDRSDMIVAAADRSPGMASDGTGTYVNAGVGRSYGAELLLQARGERYFGWAAYSLGRSERRDHPMDGERLFDSDQTHNLIVLGSVKLGAGNAWQLGGRFQLTSGTPYTPVMGAVFDSDRNLYNPAYGKVNSLRNPTQHQLDVRVDRSFAFGSWKLSAYLDVANVYFNAPVVGYTYNANYTERTETKGIPILPSIGVRGEF